MDEILDLVEVLDGIEQFEMDRSEENVFEYAGRPCDPIDTLEVSNYVFLDNDYCDCESDCEDDEDSDYDRKYRKVIKRNNLKSIELLEGIKYVICVITYPVTNHAIFKFDCSNINVTYGVIMYLYSYAYQRMYELEEDEGESTPNIPGMLNRGRSAGRFGIWGHDITDLVYNGNSSIKYVDDGETVVCEFDCDS